MNSLTDHLFSAIFIGIGATLTFDAWSWFLRVAFKITPSNICLVGRWLLFMPEGIFKHSSIITSPHKSGECTIGWIAHYLFGITFAIVFVAIAGVNWVQNPTLIPALFYGIATVLAPFLIMQPSFGFGIAASKTSMPGQSRFRSLMNHTAFGAGLYLFALLIK